MAGNNLNVSVVVGLVDRLSRPLQGLRRNLEGTLNATANMTFVGDALGRTGQALTRPLADAADQAMRFESAMADVKKVVDFDTPQGPAELAATLERLARSIPLAADELAQIAAAGGQLGLGAGDLPAYVETVAKAATAFDMLPDRAGEAFAKLANVYAIPIEQIGSLGDAINHLSNNTAAKASEIVDATMRIGGQGRQFGLTAQQVGALSATMIGLGKTPEIAGTGINALLTKLQTAPKQSQKFQDALEQIGLSGEALARSIGEDAQGALTDFLGRLSQVEGSARAGLLVDLFGLEYADDISALAGNMDQYRRALGMVSDAQGYAGSMQAEFNARADTTANGMQLLANRVAELKRTIGDALTPVLDTLGERLGAVVSRVNDWLREHPNLTRVLAIGAGVLGAFMSAVGGLLTASAGIVGSLAAMALAVGGIGRLAALALAPLRLLLVPLMALHSVGPAAAAAMRGVRGMAMALMLVQGGPLAKVLFLVRAIGAALLANPIGLVVAAFVGAVLVIRKYWEPISGFFSGLWAGITEGLAPIKPAFDAAWGGISAVLGPVISAIGRVWDWLTRLLEPVHGTGAAAEEMGRRWGAAIAGMIAKAGELVQAFLAIPGQMLTVGRQIIDGLWKGISERWAALKAKVASIANSVTNIFRKETDTHSPSRVFARLGGDLMAGLALGIEQRMGGPLAQMRTLTGDLTRTAGAVGMGGALALGAASAPAAPAAPITIHLTINAAPGTDAQGLAQMAGRELTAAAERVAALYDRSDLR